MAPNRLLALFGAKTLEALIDATFDVLQAAVVCDLLSAFYRTAGDGLMKQRDSRGREPGPDYMNRYMELTPALPIALANPGVKILTTGSILPSDGELRKSAFYREIMQVEGWRHGVALCFWGDPMAASPVFVTSVYRRDGQSDFSQQDISSLERVYPFLDCAVNRVYEHEAAKTVRDGIAMAVSGGTRGFAILDRNLLLVQANPVARQLCGAWVDDATPTPRESSSSRWRLPPTLLAACRGLQHEWREIVHSEPDAIDVRRGCCLVHPHVPGLTASITMVCPSTTGLAEPTFLIEFDRRVHGVALDTPDRFAPVLKKMTAAERAVAMVLADGLSNQEIAERLGKSVDAVKFLLHRVYTKTGVPSRAALVAVLRAHIVTSD